MKRKESFLIKGENESFGVDLSRVDIDFLKEVRENQDGISKGLDDIVHFYSMFALGRFSERIEASDFYQDKGIKSEASSFISELTNLADQTVKSDEADTGSIDSLKEKLKNLKVYAEYLYLLHFIKPDEEINKKTVEQAVERKRESEKCLSELLDEDGFFLGELNGLSSGILNHKNFEEYFAQRKRPSLKKRYTRLVSKHSIKEISHNRNILLAYRKVNKLKLKDTLRDFNRFLMLHDNLFLLDNLQEVVDLVSIKQEFEKEKRELEAEEKTPEVVPQKEEPKAEEEPKVEEQKPEEDVHKIAKRKVKEKVSLAYFYWFFKDGKSIKDGVGDEELKEIFEKIKDTQNDVNRKIIIAMISDVSEEEGRKLLEEFKGEAVANGLPEDTINGIAVEIGKKYITKDREINLERDSIDISYQDKRLRNNVKGIKKQEGSDTTFMRYDLADVAEEDLELDKMYRAISKNSRLVSIYLDREGRRAYMVSDARSPRILRIMLDRAISEDYIIIPNMERIRKSEPQEEQK